MHVIIIAKANTDLDEDHPDIKIPGMYEAQLADDTPPDLVVSAALDGFHCSYGIDELEDFDISVHDAGTGEMLTELEGVEGYQNEDYCESVEFLGEQIDPKFLGAPTRRISP